MLFRSPEPDQREAHEGGKLSCFSPLRKVLILGLVLTCGAGSDHRSPTNGRREVRLIMRCTWGGSFGRVWAWRVAYLGRLRYRLGLKPAAQFRERDVWP